MQNNENKNSCQKVGKCCLLSKAACIPSKFDKLICDNRKSLILILICSFVYNYLFEASLRQNLFTPLKLLFTSPIVFILGMLIVLSTFSFMYFFSRRTFVFGLCSFLWLIVLLVNFVLMCVYQRSTPFNFSDLRVFSTTKDIVNNGYVNLFEIILIVLGIFLFLAFLSFVYVKCSRLCTKANICAFISIQICAITLITTVCYTNFAVSANRFDNLPNKYREHGFAFCFLYSLIDNGIDKPADYTSELYDDTRNQVNKEFEETDTISVSTNIEKVDDPILMDEVFDLVISDIKTMPDYEYLSVSANEAYLTVNQMTERYEKHSSSSSFSSADQVDGTINAFETFPEHFDKPNIIFMQLESFYDVNNIMGYEYSENPHPIYSLLKETLPGGKLTVPSIGAGTANTEFEIMTGMDVSFFGIAEYPYLSVLQNQTCESICYNARDYGYTCHAIHNHKGTFYDRYRVFANLGYDTFTSIESFNHIERNQRNWCKDSALIEPIMVSLDSTPGMDLVYGISVQPHGKYPSESVYETILDGELPRVQVSGNEHNPENPGFTYYVNQLKEVDNFIGSLLLELNYRNEPTILVLYGDHLPSFSVQKYWNLKEGNCYQTDYIIWNNCGMDFSDAKDLTTFQLASYIFSKAGIDSGEVNKLNRMHLSSSDVSEYHNLRHRYQYAIFYDSALKDPTSKISVPKYERVNTEYGILKASIDNVYTIGATTYITGDGFNEFTYVFINGQNVETQVLDSATITTDYVIAPGDIVSTGQMSNGATLGQSGNVITYDESMIIPENLHEEVLDEIMPIVLPSKSRYEEYEHNLPESPTPLY